MTSPYPHAAERYDTFRHHIWQQAVPTVHSQRPSSHPDELELQACWFGGEYGRTFTGTEGEQIEIVQFGFWNRSSGPDFTHAAILIDGIPHHGSIEIDPDARDWERHGHGENPDFEDTILHVFIDTAARDRVYTRTDSHRLVPQILLPQYQGSRGAPDFLPEAFPGRCLTPLSRMSEDEIKSLLIAAAQYRLKQKAERLRVMAVATSLRQALYQAIAEALGFGRNKTSMAILAQRCPLEQMLAIDRTEREARLFGTAGFLDPALADSSEAVLSHDYQLSLWHSWWRIRDQIEPAPHRAISWRSDGTRPHNHPQRRIAALACLLDRWGEVENWWDNPEHGLGKIVNNCVQLLFHPYWSYHFTLLSKASEKPIRLVGQDRTRDILGNVIFPYTIVHYTAFWQEYEQLRSVDQNRKLRRACLRLFGQDTARKKLFTSYYYQQQGLLQIYQDFCLDDTSDCASCPFPEQLLQWRTGMGTE